MVDAGNAPVDGRIPDNAAQRIAREWVGLVGRPRFVMDQSHTRPHSLWRRNAEGKHWDICFVYELAVRGIPKTRPWWSEMRIVPFSQVRRMKMGRGHKDVLKAAGYI